MDYVIFDTETTGLIRHASTKLDDQPRIIEFAGIRINSKGKELRRLEFICNAGVKLTEEIINITGITQAQVDKAKPFKSFQTQMVLLFQNADCSVAHNHAFDRQIVDFDCKRNKMTWIWPKRSICTIEATEYIKGRRMKLIELHEYLFGEPFVGAHRAMTDVEALTRCFKELLKREIVT